MLRIAASVVDHPATWLFFALIGFVVACIFILFGIDFLKVDPISEKATFVTGVSMLLGQAGWWLRVLFRYAFFQTRRMARIVEVVLLSTGIATVIYGLAFMPKGPAALPLLITLLASGALMLLGTIARKGSGA